MKFKQKSWFWYLTFPFAHRNYTTIGDVLFFPKGKMPHESIINHEKIHMKQQSEVGVLKFLFLYLFCFPFLYNPWRYKWEMEAFVSGSELSEDFSKKILSSYRYGWLRSVK